LQSYTQILLALNAFVHAYTIHTVIYTLKITARPSYCEEDTVYFPERLYTAALEPGDY